MSAARYFVLGPVPGTPHQRYALIEGSVVVQIVASRPDGVEIPPPIRYRIALRPAFGSGAGHIERGAQAFGTVAGDALARARQRAGEKGRRALDERRQLMPGGERDEKLADARSSGAKALERVNAERRFRRAA
jgi:hypothetical protein